jgi:hypothetical protein
MIEFNSTTESFLAMEIYGLETKIKGAFLKGSEGEGAFILWERRWWINGNNLCRCVEILRLTVEGDMEQEDSQRKIASLLRAAVLEARIWQMEEVRISNPPKAILKATGSFFNAQNLEFGPDEDEGGISCLS